MAALRRPVLAANWKMNLGPTAAAAFFEAFLVRYAPRDDRTVVLFPSAIAFGAARAAAATRPDVQFGVQNIHTAEKGAFTGETWPRWHTTPAHDSSSSGTPSAVTSLARPTRRRRR